MNDGEDGKVGGELLNDLFSALEDLETQSAGIVQFLKDKGLADDEQLAPYLKSAGNASEVRWRAVRLRMNALLNGALSDAEEEVARKVEERILKKEQDRKARQKQDGENHDVELRYVPKERSGTPESKKNGQEGSPPQQSAVERSSVEPSSLESSSLEPSSQKASTEERSSEGSSSEEGSSEGRSPREQSVSAGKEAKSTAESPGKESGEESTIKRKAS